MYVELRYPKRESPSRAPVSLFIMYCSSGQIFLTSNACFKYSSLVINSFSKPYTSVHEVEDSGLARGTLVGLSTVSKNKPFDGMYW